MKNMKAYPGCVWHLNFYLSIKMAIWVNDDKSVLKIKAQSYPMPGVTIIALLALIAVNNINPLSEGGPFITFNLFGVMLGAFQFEWPTHNLFIKVTR